jgi:hypothetical protein
MGVMTGYRMARPATQRDPGTRPLLGRAPLLPVMSRVPLVHAGSAGLRPRRPTLAPIGPQITSEEVIQPWPAQSNSRMASRA